MKKKDYQHGFEAKLKPVVELLENYFSGKLGNEIPTFSKPMTATKLVALIKNKLQYPKFQESNLRDCVHQIREMGNIPMGSGTRGYFRIYNTEELQAVVRQLESRSNKTMKIAVALRNFDQSKFTL